MKLHPQYRIDLLFTHETPVSKQFLCWKMSHFFVFKLSEIWVESTGKVRMSTCYVQCPEGVKMLRLVLFTQKQRISYYNAVIKPVLRYVSVVWRSLCSKVCLARIIRLQKRRGS